MMTPQRLPHVTVSDLVERVIENASDRERYVLGITGPPGAGKSTLAEALVDAISEAAGEEVTAYVPMDGYHLPNAELDDLGLRSVKGAPKTFDARGFAHLLLNLCKYPHRTHWAPEYSRELHNPVPDAIRIDPAQRIVVTEGNYLLLEREPWNRIPLLASDIWFMDTPWPTARERLAERHTDTGRTPHEANEKIARTDAPNTELVAETIDRADLVLETVALK